MYIRIPEVVSCRGLVHSLPVGVIIFLTQKGQKKYINGKNNGDSYEIKYFYS